MTRRVEASAPITSGAYERTVRAVGTNCKNQVAPSLLSRNQEPMEVDTIPRPHITYELQPVAGMQGWMRNVPTSTSMLSAGRTEQILQLMQQATTPGIPDELRQTLYRYAKQLAEEPTSK